MFNTQTRGATAEMQYQIVSTMIERPPNVRNFMQNLTYEHPGSRIGAK